MAWVTLLKSTETSTGKKLPVGTKVNVSRKRYKQLIAEESIEDYNGVLPPKKKAKVNLSRNNKKTIE